MLDIKFIRENPDLVKQGIKNKNEKDRVDEILALDEKRRKKPLSENVKIYQTQKKLFHALSARVRGLKGENPFQIRARLL